MGWVGLDEVYAALDKMKVAADRGSKIILVKSVAVVIRLAQGNFKGSHKTGMPHVGGRQPNIVTGYLRRSIRSSPIVRLGLSDYKTTVGPNAVYGRAVELGLHGHEGYPFFGPAVVEATPEMVRIRDETWASIFG